MVLVKDNGAQSLLGGGKVNYKVYDDWVQWVKINESILPGIIYNNYLDNNFQI